MLQNYNDSLKLNLNGILQCGTATKIIVLQTDRQTDERMKPHHKVPFLLYVWNPNL